MYWRELRFLISHKQSNDIKDWVCKQSEIEGNTNKNYISFKLLCAAIWLQEKTINGINLSNPYFQLRGNEVDWYGASVWHYLALSGNYAALLEAINAKLFNPDTLKTVDGSTVWHYLAWSGYYTSLFDVSKKPLDIFDLLKQMNDFIKKADWHGLIEKHKILCNNYAGHTIENTISSIDTSTYKSNLKYYFDQAISQAIEINALAIYFEYNLDNLWSGLFCICEEYTAYERCLEIGDDWACNFVIDINGPNFEEFSNQYAMTQSFNGDNASIAITTYLIARTIFAFGRVVHLTDTKNLNICIGFHDQDPIMRIKENL